MARFAASISRGCPKVRGSCCAEIKYLTTCNFDLRTLRRFDDPFALVEPCSLDFASSCCRCSLIFPYISVYGLMNFRCGSVNLLANIRLISENRHFFRALFTIGLRIVSPLRLAASAGPAQPSVHSFRAAGPRFFLCGGFPVLRRFSVRICLFFRILSRSLCFFVPLLPFFAR